MKFRVFVKNSGYYQDEILERIIQCMKCPKVNSRKTVFRPEKRIRGMEQIKTPFFGQI